MEELRCPICGRKPKVKINVEAAYAHDVFPMALTADGYVSSYRGSMYCKPIFRPIHIKVDSYFKPTKESLLESLDKRWVNVAKLYSKNSEVEQ